MSINDLPVLSALRTKMQWHQERQRVLSENVSNSDTPKFRPRDLVEPKLDKAGAVTGSMGPLALTRTSGSHIAPSGGALRIRPEQECGF
ncbi:flagellar basal body rod protein FlgB [Bradyrhizobium sp. LM6.11]